MKKKITVTSSNETKKERNYRSRYERNRDCYRKDETTYVYQQWIPTGKKTGYYIDHEFVVGKDGVTLELLDYLLESDNASAQDQEDSDRFTDQGVVNEEGTESNGAFSASAFSNLSTSRVSGSSFNLSGRYNGSPELVGPEAVLFAEEEEQSELAKQFEEKVNPTLTEEQRVLICQYYGMDMSLEEIAQLAPLNAKGEHITAQAIFNRLQKIKNKTKKNITLDE